MMEVNRRQFLATGAAAAAAATEKLVDGGLADVSEPGVPEREAHLVPPGAKGFANFQLRCVGCQLCVAACPNDVLRPSRDGARLARPEMGFERGWCRPECVACGEVCPAGAIRRLSVERKAHVHVGVAKWHRDRCVAANEGVVCTSCERHCPARAITLVALDPADRKSPCVPVVDEALCLGCGACENLCPARPLPAMTVLGLERHREVVKMGDVDLIAEATALFSRRAAAAVLVKDGVFVATVNGRGVRPLLELLDHRPADFRGAWVIDKVFGRAAAAIAICGGATRVWAEVMSEGAAELLCAHGIAVGSSKRVKKIVNRAGTGECPLEQAVKDLDDPKAMLAAVRAKSDELAAQAVQAK